MTRVMGLVVMGLMLAGSIEPALAQSSQFDMPVLKLENLPGGGQNLSLSLQALILMTLLTVLPSLLLVTTSFTRIIITLSILRQALGTQQTPPNQVLVGLALFLTLFIMTPTFNLINDTAFAPYSQGQIGVQEAGLRAAPVMGHSLKNGIMTISAIRHGGQTKALGVKIAA